MLSTEKKESTGFKIPCQLFARNKRNSKWYSLFSWAPRTGFDGTKIKLVQTNCQINSDFLIFLSFAYSWCLLTLNIQIWKMCSSVWDVSKCRELKRKPTNSTWTWNVLNDLFVVKQHSVSMLFNEIKKANESQCLYDDAHPVYTTRCALVCW